MDSAPYPLAITSSRNLTSPPPSPLPGEGRVDPTVRIRHENREMIRIAKLCFFDLFNEHSLSRPRTLSYNTLYFTISFSTPLPPFHLPLPPSTLSSPSSHPLLPPSTPPHYPSLPSFYSCGSGGIGSFPLTLPNPLLTLPNPLVLSPPNPLPLTPP